MKKLLFAMFALVCGLSAGFGGELSDMECIKTIMLSCRHPGGPTPTDDLRTFASVRKLTNREMSDLLLQLAGEGLCEGADAMQRRLAHGAIWGLLPFGGDAEIAFVRNVMRTTTDESLRQTAVHVGIRMEPGKWEEWVREVAADRRCASLTRFDAYEEAYRIGQSGDEQTRNRVGQVLSELAEKESSAGNRANLQRWASELKER